MNGSGARVCAPAAACSILRALARVGTRAYDPGMAPTTDPVLAAFAELGGLSAVADRLGFASDEDARQAIHAAFRRSDQDTPGDMLDLDGPAAEVDEQQRGAGGLPQPRAP